MCMRDEFISNLDSRFLPPDTSIKHSGWNPSSTNILKIVIASLKYLDAYLGGQTQRLFSAKRQLAGFWVVIQFWAWTQIEFSKCIREAAQSRKV